MRDQLLADDVVVDRDVLVPMRDGIRLATDIYRRAGQRLPAVLVRTPYGKTMIGIGTASIADFVGHGYAVVVQDARGRFNSEGNFVPFFADADDGADTVEWTAAQEWCTGRVGMVGASYVGLTQLLAASAAPDALRAIVPSATASALADHWVYNRGGTLEHSFVLAWTVLLAQDRAKRLGLDDAVLSAVGASSEKLNQAVAEHDWDAVAEAMAEQAAHIGPLHAARPVRSLPFLDRAVPFVCDWLDWGPASPAWRAASPAALYERMHTPAIHITGWFDFFVDGVISNYVGMRNHAASSEARRHQMLVVGPWGHSNYDPLPPHQVGEIDFGSAADLDVHSLERHWMDQWLKEEQSGVLELPPVQLFVMGINEWHAEEEWPLARTRWTRWYLHSGGNANTTGGDGRLSVEVPLEEPPDHFLFDPVDPTPAHGGAALGAGFATGPVDQSEIERRDDVLVYTSEVLAEPVEVTGWITAELWIASDALDTDFTAKLVDVTPEGTAFNVCDGIVRARFRDGRSSPRLIEPGVPTTCEIRLNATSIVFLAGHRIRVEVSSSCYPRYAANSNTGGDPEQETNDDLRAANQTVFHDAARPSSLLLPVIPARTSAVGAASTRTGAASAH